MNVVLGTNGRIWMLSSGDDEVERILEGLNGDRWHSLVLGRLAQSVDFRSCNPAEELQEYLQCAGSAARMTLEIRRWNQGTYKQYTVGKPSDIAHLLSPRETVRWGDHVVHVHPHELFTASEALPIFIEYSATGDLPAGLQLRALPL